MLGCLGALLLAAGVAGGAQTVEAGRSSHIRTSRPDAAALVDAALDESRTVRELAAELSTTDAIIYVELARHAAVKRAGTVLLSAASGVRYVLITIHPDHDRLSRIAYFGHELQHALEIAKNPHVKDQASLRRLFQRIGTDPGAVGDFETEAAEAVGRKVWLEASGALARRERAAAQSARPMRSWSFSR